jgi:hypothetical protein
MTQESFYWSGTTSDSPGDAGPYAENTMWRNLAQAAIAGGAESDSDLYNIGVFYSVANKLEVTLDGTNLDVNTGAALVDGAYYENDASVDITVDAAAAGDERIDYIVLRKCYEGSTYNPGGNVPAVDEQEVRITVIKGAEVTPPAVPSTPSLTQDTGRTTYWDIPLATVEVDDTGATSVTDAREYVEVTKKEFLVDSGVAYDFTNNTLISSSFLGSFLDNSVGGGDIISGAFANWYVPDDFVSDLKVSAVYRQSNALIGFFHVTHDAEYGGENEDWDTHSAITTDDLAGPASKHNKVYQELSLSDASAGDFVKSKVLRDATDVGDTLTAPMYLVGFLVEYLGLRKNM